MDYAHTRGKRHWASSVRTLAWEIAATCAGNSSGLVLADFRLSWPPLACRTCLVMTLIHGSEKRTFGGDLNLPLWLTLTILVLHFAAVIWRSRHGLTVISFRFSNGFKLKELLTWNKAWISLKSWRNYRACPPLPHHQALQSRHRILTKICVWVRLMRPWTRMRGYDKASCQERLKEIYRPCKYWGNDVLFEYTSQLSGLERFNIVCVTFDFSFVKLCNWFKISCYILEF